MVGVLVDMHGGYLNQINVVRTSGDACEILELTRTQASGSGNPMSAAGVRR